ncbi:MAG: HAD-IIA family hydrolase [Anaerolineae bacterium]|jgi:4-nitrophenyl phosphatase
MKRGFRLEDVQVLIVDMDGTLFRGPIPLPGLQRFFAFLQDRRISFVVVSNNATKTAGEYRQRLAGQGVQIQEEQILTAATATTSYLESELGAGASLYVIGETALTEMLHRAGFSMVHDASQPADAVVVGGDSTLTYDKLKYAALLLQRGARFVGTNPDLLCPTEEGLVPEAGATLAALQAATGIAPIVIGKPARPLFDLALQRLGSHPVETAVLGDRLETDIRGGQQAGLKTVLVTTGIDDKDSVRQKGIEPDLVVSGLDMLVDLWERVLEQWGGSG